MNAMAHWFCALERESEIQHCELLEEAANSFPFDLSSGSRLDWMREDGQTVFPRGLEEEL